MTTMLDRSQASGWWAGFKARLGRLLKWQDAASEESHVDHDWAVPMVQYWDSDSIPPDVMRGIQTFRDKNANFRHLLFSEKTATDFIEEHFTSREVTAFRACAVPALQSDYFRYCAVLVLGGVYSDAHMRCVANLGPLLARVEEAQCYINQRNPHIIRTDFFVVRFPGNPLLRFALDVATANIEHRRFERSWFAAGPGIISSLYGIHIEGSLEAYLKNAVPKRTPPRQEAARRLADIVHTKAGARSAELLARAQFSPLAERMPFVVELEVSYKKGKRHWMHWEGSIYR